MTPRRRKNAADGWLPKRVYRGKSAFEYHTKDGKVIRLCRLTASPGEVLKAYEAAASAPDESTLAWLVKQYESSPQYARLSASTKADYRQTQLKPLAVFGKLPVDQIAGPQIQRYVDARGKVAPYRANREGKYVLHVLKWGAARGYVANPPQHVLWHPEQRRTRYVTAEEYQAVYKEAGPALRVAMEVAACTGLRRADILALRWDQVTEDGILVVQSKTGTAILKQRSPRLDRALAAARQLPRPKNTVSVYVVHTRTGAKYTASGFNSVFYRACVDAGQDWHFHDLRRTAITDAGGDKRFSGHRTEAMAARYNVKPIKSPSH